MELKLDSEIIYENKLDTIKFAKMLDDPSQCYKFYWLEAILNLIRDNEVVSFDAIINEMICLVYSHLFSPSSGTGYKKQNREFS